MYTSEVFPEQDKLVEHFDNKFLTIFFLHFELFELEYSYEINHRMFAYFRVRNDILRNW